MVATDTLVGIVGAVVLVAAMAGVFVYEYNNVPEDGGGIEDRFAHLSPDGDIDGDDIRNADDDDIDGDGTPNDEDSDIVVVSTKSGGLGPRMEPAVGPSGMLNAVLEEGAKGIRVVATFTPTATDPSGTLNGFQLTVDLDGAELGSDSSSSSAEVASTEVDAGTLTAVVKPTQGSFGGDYSLTIELIY